MRFDTVRSTDVNNAFDLVSAGFEKLPTPYKVNGGSANYAADTGAANAYVVALSSQITSYTAGLTIQFKALASNTGASTVNVNSLGAKNIVQPDGATALTSGMILAGQIVEATYDGTSFQMKRSSTTFTNDPGAIQSQTYTAATTGGTSTAYTITPTPVIAAYAANQSFFVNFHTASGAAPTLQISGVATPPNLVKQNEDGTYTNISAGEIPANHRSRVTLLSATQALVEDLPPDFDVGTNNFRLTLTSGLPVTTADVANAGTIYACPYKGDAIALYVNSQWRIHRSAEFSLALSGLTSGRPYDVFAYSNAGVPALEFLAWTNDTTRATALAYQDGVLVKTGDATRRYLGTFYTTGVATTEDSLTSRYLWNYYHRVARPMRRVDPTASWTYSTAAFRQANANAANQLNFVLGLAEDSVRAEVGHLVSTSSTTVAVYSAIGLDSTTASVGLPAYIEPSSPNARNGVALYRGNPSAGRHYLAWLERGAGADTQTWFGTGAILLHGILGEVFA